MICKNCGNEMLLDDVDFNFKGNKDNYFLCEFCHMGAVEKIRYGKRFKVIWSEGEKGDVPLLDNGNTLKSNVGL